MNIYAPNAISSVALRQRVRDLHPERRRDQRGRHHQQRADQRHIADRKRHLQRGDIGKARCRRPAGIDIADRAGDRDQDRDRRRGRDRLMDRPAIERHQQVREQAAADAHQGRQQPDEEAVDAHQKALRHVVAELPVVARQQQPRRRRPRHHHEHDLEQPLRRIARGDAAGENADHDRQPPAPEDVHVDRAPLVMGAKRGERGRDDDRQRSADAERHPHLQRHAGQPEAFVEHRHQDRAAADAEHAGQKSRQRPDRDQQQGEFDEFFGIKAGHHVFEHPTFRTCDPRICMAARET